MSEYLHPGVYIERRAGGPAPIVGVSTSNFGTCGYTRMGLTDVAALVTSWEQFQSKFGTFTSKGLVPTSVFAFFANGGRRAYVVRVVASDAAASYCDVPGTVITAETPADTTPTPDDAETEFTFTLTNPPAKRGSVVFGWTSTATPYTMADNGDGTLTGVGAASACSGTIDYETGVCTANCVGLPPTVADFSNDYIVAQWTLDATSKGEWGNWIRTEIQGNPDYWNADAATYTRWDFLVYVKDEGTQEYILRETFEACSFTDADDDSYFPDCVNDDIKGSDFVTVSFGTESGVCSDLIGTAVTSEAPSDTAPTPDSTEVAFTFTLDNPVVAKTTVTISYTDSADAAKTITDDGAGNLIGDVDATGNNTINYTTGAIDVKVPVAVKTSTDFSSDYYTMPASSSCVCTYTGGSDGTAAISRNEVSNPTLAASFRGIYALGKTEEFLNVGIPDFAGNVTVANDCITEAESRKDWFIVLATPAGMDPQEAKDFRQLTGAWNTKYAALYWPWIKISDPVTNNTLDIPPVGHVVGVYARTDTKKNVGKSPGGIEDGKLNFSIGLEYDVELGEIDILNPAGVNSLYQSVETGRVVWGVRTLEIGGEFRYINAQRLFMFVAKSLYRSTHWVVFENNSADLQIKVKTQAESFLLNLYKNGYFAGTSPTEAFFVVCSGQNNPPESVDLGRIICDVGMAPNKPAEFCIYRLQQKTLE